MHWTNVIAEDDPTIWVSIPSRQRALVFVLWGIGLQYLDDFFKNGRPREQSTETSSTITEWVPHIIVHAMILVKSNIFMVVLFQAKE